MPPGPNCRKASRMFDAHSTRRSNEQRRLKRVGGPVEERQHLTSKDCMSCAKTEYLQISFYHSHTRTQSVMSLANVRKLAHFQLSR